ncbi:protoporphyrinogen oxidase [Boudabousia tangfeifanii]|uniref:Coproporphyrinogen III oxidase n=1 Tax=Boudabousia tangfeifanii TaxID=1912795 RepID=A0A1D9MMN3_9ACTO|nr:protoporphyrinogen oxidase [Boudabousia tangfeifanii]
MPVVIIGGGITGLSVAAGLARRGKPFVILEAADRLGGQIRTIKRQGYTFEVGPNTGTVSTPEVAELFEFASSARLEVANETAKARWIWQQDRFRPLPSGLLSAATTPLFTFRDKLRVLGEPWRKRGTNPNETVGELAARRLGKSFVRNAVDPFIGGIYAGDPYRLVTRFALPKLYNLEANHGSFIRGSIAKMRTPKTDRDRKATKQVFSAEGGLTALVDALETALQPHGKILTGVQNVSAKMLAPHQWQVSFTHQGQAQELIAQTVVSTVRADLLAPIFPDLTGKLAPIESLRYAPVAEVVFGYDHLPSVNRKAFGGLVPSEENRDVLGILFPSSCFAGRTPHPDSALFTVFVGGMRRGQKLLSLAEDELVALARREVENMLQIPQGVSPDLVEVARYPKAIAQYEASTEQRLERISQLEYDYPGLILAGAIRDGIGLAHRITQGSQIGAMLAVN